MTHLLSILVKRLQNTITTVRPIFRAKVNINPDVYSCISQDGSKAVAVPYTIKVVKDIKAYQQLNNQISTKGYIPSHNHYK
jgi:hypothetical protein